jgi:hypothetical protein
MNGSGAGRVMLGMVALSVACGRPQGARVVEHAASATSSARPPKVTVARPPPSEANTVATSEKASAPAETAEPAPSTTNNAAPACDTSVKTTEVEGVVFGMCAYGPPGYGESPGSDAKEQIAVLLLDKAWPAVAAEAPEGIECVKDVTLLQLRAADGSKAPRPQSLARKHVTLAVSAIETGDTGHDHTRVGVAYEAVRSSRLDPARTLGSHWATVSHDFVGAPCKGFP